MFNKVNNKAVKVFSELYVGYKLGNPKLGFATPYEDNAAGLRRQRTVDNWAYVYSKNENLKSEIIKNVARKGFKITDDIKRTYWGGGNVSWRVLDPHGFELEIQSNNLMALIQSCGISAGGEILEECVWARDGANNILLPTSTEEYKNSIKGAESIKKTAKIHKKDLVIGHSYLLQNGSEGQYLGKVWINITVDSHKYNRNTKQNIHISAGNKFYYGAGIITEFKIEEDVEQYEAVLLKNSNFDIILYKSISAILETDNKSLSAEDGCALINNPEYKLSYGSTSKYLSYDSIVKATIVKKEMTLVFSPLPKEFFDLEIKKVHEQQNILYRTNQILGSKKQRIIYLKIGNFLFDRIDSANAGAITVSNVNYIESKTFTKINIQAYSRLNSKTLKDESLIGQKIHNSAELMLIENYSIFEDLESEFIKGNFFQLTLE